MTPIRRLDHIGIAVRDTENALRYFTGQLGLEVVHVDVIEELAVRLTYLDVGNAYLQLVEPLNDSSPIAASLAQAGEGVHHICFGVDDVPSAAAELAETEDDVPLGRGRNRTAAFVPGPVRHGVRIECTEFDRGADVDAAPGWLPDRGGSH
jgi:methylmalonyl-CoA/ethylmalonyl-CoA epimerase